MELIDFFCFTYEHEGDKLAGGAASFFELFMHVDVCIVFLRIYLHVHGKTLSEFLQKKKKFLKNENQFFCLFDTKNLLIF